MLRAMPDNSGALSEQPAEASWRWVRKFREHFTPQVSKKASLQYPFIRKLEMADPEMLSINKEFVLKYRPKHRAYPAEVISMMRPSSRPLVVALEDLPQAGPPPSSESSDSEAENNEAVPPPQQQVSGPRITSLFDALGVGADSEDEDDDDDPVVMVTPSMEDPGSTPTTNDPEPSTSGENPSKRRKTY